MTTVSLCGHGLSCQLVFGSTVSSHGNLSSDGFIRWREHHHHHPVSFNPIPYLMTRSPCRRLSSSGACGVNSAARQLLFSLSPAYCFYRRSSMKLRLVRLSCPRRGVFISVMNSSGALSSNIAADSTVCRTVLRWCQYATNTMLQFKHVFCRQYHVWSYRQAQRLASARSSLHRHRAVMTTIRFCDARDPRAA